MFLSLQVLCVLDGQVMGIRELVFHSVVHETPGCVYGEW